jgi:adenylate cyclase
MGEDSGEPGRQAAILFADVSQSMKLYELAGDHIAHQTVERCIEVMRRATAAAGGRVVKTIGDEVLAVFGSSDAAAVAASEMQAATDQMPPVANTKLGLRIGFHYGPVLQRDGDVFGDTVNLAARLVAQAAKGQILTSNDTASQLSAPLRGLARQLYDITVKGKAQEVSLCEVTWKRAKDQDTTILAAGRQPARRSALVLRLRYRGKEIIRRRDNDFIDIGRDNDCGLMITDHMASRRHCIIERRADRFVLKDHSTNGTYLTLEGDSEQHLRREEAALRKHGWIAFGQPRAGTDDVVEFFLD